MNRRLSLTLLLTLLILATTQASNSVRTAAAQPVCSTSGPPSYSATLCFDTPADGASLTGVQNISVTMTVSGTDPGVDKYFFYMDGAYLLTDLGPNGAFELPTHKLVDGPRLVEVEALMKDNFITDRAAISVTFDNGIVEPPVNNNTFAPRTGSPAPGQPLVLASVGDGASGRTTDTQVSDLILSWNPDVFLYLGDVYEKGSMAEFYNWYGTDTTYFGRLRAITNPTIGNHEDDLGTTAPYFDYWDNVPHYYSFDSNGWHIISLDSTNLFDQTVPGTPQYDWLVQDLNGNTSDCTLAYFHHPRYSVGSQGDTPRLDGIWSLLAQHGVDIVLAGHDHNYQRWDPLDGNGNPDPQGMTQFIIGGGGRNVQSFARNDNRLAAGLDDTADGFGALRLELSPGTATYRYDSIQSAGLDSGIISCSASTAVTFSVWRDGNTYHAEATSIGSSYSGSLKFVVESAMSELNSIGGGVISFQAGDFDLGADSLRIVDVADIVFEGQGIDVTVVRNNSDAAADTEPFNSARSSRITIRDLTVSASGSLRSTSDAIDFDAGNEVLIERVKVIDSRSRGIIFDGKDQGQMANGNTVRDCIVTGIPGDGIELLASSNNLITNCTITDVGGYGIQINKSSPIAPQANKPSDDNTISGNLLDNTGSDGINLKSSNRNVITGNTVLNSSDDSSGRDGIHITSSDDVICDDNVIEFNTATDNQPIKTQEFGLNIGSSFCSGTVVRDNDFTGNLSGEINDDGTDTIYASSDTEPPSMPTNLSATSITEAQVTLAWGPSTDNIGVNSYWIYRDGSQVGTVSGAETQFQDTSVVADMLYQYYVRARDAAGNLSDPSNTIFVSTPPPPPTLTFSAADDATIRENRSNRNFGTDSELAVDGRPIKAALLKFNISGIGTEAIASAKIRLYNLDGSPEGGEFFAVTDNSWSEETVTWDTAPPGDGGSIGSFGNVDSGNWYELDVTPLVTGDGPVSVRISSNTANGADYASKENSNGNGPELVVTLGEPPAADQEPPSPPGNLVATDIQATEVSIAWDASTDNVGVTGYDIYRDGALLDSAGVATSYQDLSVSPENAYQYAVYARDAAGNVSDPSNLLDVNTPAFPVDETPPTPPGNLTATDVQPTTVSLSWDASSDDVGVVAYDIYRDGGFLDSVGPVNSYRDTTVAPENAYQYILYARDAAGNVSDPSNLLDVDTPAIPVDETPPTPPGNLTAVDVQPTTVSLSWDASSDDVGVVAYDIYRNGGFLDSVSPVTTYQDTTVAPEFAYQYIVYARDAASNVSDPSNSADVVTPAQPSELTLLPTDDAFVRENSPDRNYGSDPLLEVDGSSKKDVLLKFDLSGIGTASVSSATVRLYNLDGSGFGGEFFEVSDFSWTEDSVTFANAPAAGASLGSLGSVSPGNWYEIDLTTLVNAVLSNGGTQIALRITSPDANGADYASKENVNGNAPQLFIIQ